MKKSDRDQKRIVDASIRMLEKLEKKIEKLEKKFSDNNKKEDKMCYLEKKIEKLEKKFSDKMCSLEKKIACERKQELAQITQMNRRVNILLTDFKKQEKAFLNTVKDLTKMNYRIERHIRYLKLAINQNEYLQAWFPAKSSCEQKKTDFYPFLANCN